MALSNLDKNTLKNLFKMINLEENNNDRLIQSIKNDYLTYSKLEMISKQISILKSEANNILKHHKFNIDISNIECNFKKTPGTYYYLYKKKDIYLSLIPPNEWWGDPGQFITKLYYDHDLTFYKVEI
tara:strand:+ start:3963 stop:4343 length:381 start_codon:yes stop_codon:yes gene_type:complete